MASSSKPFLVSKPRAFMMFHTSGLNTGSVRLETLITGFCWACAGTDAVPMAAIVKATDKRGKAAARQVRHGHFPLVVTQPVILRVTWLERDCDFTPLSFACK